MFKQLGAAAAFSLEDELQIPSVVNFAPLAIAPIPTPFGERKRPSFPIYGKRKPPEQQGVVPEYEEDTSGGPDYEDVTIEDLPTDLSSLLGGTGKSGKVDVFGKDFQIGPKGTRATFGVVQAFDPGKAIGQVASMSGSFITAGYAGQKNLEQLQYAQAMAGLGKKGYGVGVVNNQVVGVTPNHIIGTIPNASPKDMQKIRQTLTGKSGPMATGIESMKSKFSPTATFTDAEKRFQDEIIDSKLPTEVKAEILGFDPTGRGSYAFSPGRLQAQFGVTTPQSYRQGTSYKDFVKDYKAAEDFRNDMMTSPSMNFGLETDVVAQQSQVNPMGINIGIDMDNITGVGTGVGATGDLGGGYGGPTGGSSGLDASQPSSYDDNNDSDGGMDSGSNDGFGGGGWTAYGGRIGTPTNGFASKTETIKGVGLIEPEQTFMDTDVVRDRFEFDAEDGDYVVNGPASDVKKPQITSLINYAIKELGKEGVDIRVGNPKIKDKNKVPLIVASSEIYIPRVIAEKIGYPILEAINNSGKPEVTRLKNKLNDEPTDESKYAAYEGMRVRNPEQGFLFRRPELNLTNPSTDKPQEDAFVPGISDEPVEMTLDQQRFFNDYEFGDIKKAIKKTEIQGFEKNPFIFTGVKAKKGKSSSAFGPMQITKSLIEDFESRSPDYKTLSNEEKKYLQALKLQGEDKINKELYGVLKRGSKEMRQDVDAKKVYGKKAQGLKPYGKGTIDPEMHKKYYDKIADVILLHKLKDHKTIEDALASYGEGAGYGEKVLNDLLDIIQIK
jgi:hypothetical protein